MHTDDPHRINFKKPGARRGRRAPGLKTYIWITLHTLKIMYFGEKQESYGYKKFCAKMLIEMLQTYLQRTPNSKLASGKRLYKDRIP